MKRTVLATVVLTSMLALMSKVPSFGNTILRAADFGIKGDGITDDGPAIERAVAKLCKSGPQTTLQFEKGRTYRVLGAAHTWIFTLNRRTDVILDGAGSTFILNPKTRFLHLTECKRVKVQGFSIDFDPLPFADGVVIAADANAKTIDVRIKSGFAVPPLGGPTGEREQAYFGMLWHKGVHSLIGQHYFIADSFEAYAGSLKDRVVRVKAVNEFNGFASIKPGETEISLPVRGIAHKMEGHGASPVFVVEDNEDVSFSDINLWSGPLFGVSVARNSGRCTFVRFNIVPKPGTDRLTSTWRDGFHVKANRATLLWEDCSLEGMNDDAFNTATHSSTVVEAVEPNVIRIRQTFPLGFVPFEKGDKLGGYSIENGKLFGPATVLDIHAEAVVDALNPDKPAPPLRITLSKPLEDVRPGDVVWNITSANPNTTIRNCRIMQSCRFQSPVTIDNCNITALCWFYGDNVEGPLPHDVVVKNSRILLGRGNPAIVISVDSAITDQTGKLAVPKQPVISNVTFANNTIDGLINIAYSSNVLLRNNRFILPRTRLTLHDCRNATLDGNYLGETRLTNLARISIPDQPTRDSTTIR